MGGITAEETAAFVSFIVSNILFFFCFDRFC